MRPRDLIDFINRCLSDKLTITRLTQSDIHAAEVGYSDARLAAIKDEWANCYPGLDATFPLLARLGQRFTPLDITDEDLLEVVASDAAQRCFWLSQIGELLTEIKDGAKKARTELLSSWFTVGLVDIKNPVSHRTELSLDRAFQPQKDSQPGRDYITTRMIRSALGIVAAH